MTRPRHKYSKSDIDAALHLVSQGSSIYRAAKIYKIPRQTLSDKVHGTHPGSIGKPTTFTKEEEMKMSAYGITMAKMGYGVTTRDLSALAAKIVRKEPRRNNFKEGKPGKYKKL